MPELRFDTHFQSDGLPVPVHERIVVAVSGGSDSLALLHLLHDWRLHSASKPDLFVATVDHGLRSEAAKEAEYVARICDRLCLAHFTLNWQRSHDCAVSSAASREARYELLCSHARDVGATCIALGHTMDDQAETVVMRAAREGSNRGLSGMQQRAHYAIPDWRVCLFRPLLGVRRQQLRNYLTDLGARWIDDPSNQNVMAERVCVRRVLEASRNLPTADNIAKLANLSGRLRSFASARTAKLIIRFAEAVPVTNKDGADLAYLLRSFDDERKHSFDRHVLADAFAVLIMATGGKLSRVPRTKLEPLIEGYVVGKRVRITLGRCIVTTGKHGARFEREQRNLEPMPDAKDGSIIHDGRWILQRDQSSTEMRPFIAGLERFLPASDFPLHRAMMKIARRLT